MGAKNYFLAPSRKSLERISGDWDSQVSFTCGTRDSREGGTEFEADRLIRVLARFHSHLLKLGGFTT